MRSSKVGLQNIKKMKSRQRQKTRKNKQKGGQESDDTPPPNYFSRLLASLKQFIARFYKNHPNDPEKVALLQSQIDELKDALSAHSPLPSSSLPDVRDQSWVKRYKSDKFINKSDSGIREEMKILELILPKVSKSDQIRITGILEKYKQELKLRKDSEERNKSKIGNLPNQEKSLDQLKKHLNQLGETPQIIEHDYMSDLDFQGRLRIAEREGKELQAKFDKSVAVQSNRRPDSRHPPKVYKPVVKPFQKIDLAQIRKDAMMLAIEKDQQNAEKIARVLQKYTRKKLAARHAE